MKEKFKGVLSTMLIVLGIIAVLSVIQTAVHKNCVDKESVPTYAHDNYDISEVYSDDEIIEYVSEAFSFKDRIRDLYYEEILEWVKESFSPEDIWDYDVIEEYYLDTCDIDDLIDRYRGEIVDWVTDVYRPTDLWDEEEILDDLG